MAKKKSKIKKFLKGAGKAALLAGALYGGSKLLGKRGLKGNVSKTAAGEGIKYTPGKQIPDIHDFPKRWNLGPDDPGAMLAKGGRIGKKHGGRTGKQFGGGLNRPVAGVGSTARRDMRSGYYPSDMGMRGGTMYKKGGRVKSMGVAKRGGGVAKR